MRYSELLEYTDKSYGYWYNPASKQMFDDGSSHTSIAMNHWKEMGLKNKPKGSIAVSYVSGDVMKNNWIRVKTYPGIVAFEGENLKEIAKTIEYSLDKGEIRKVTECIIEFGELQLFKANHWESSHYDFKNTNIIKLKGYDEIEKFLKRKIK